MHEEYIEADVFCINIEGFSELQIEILKNIMEM